MNVKVFFILPSNIWVFEQTDSSLLLS